MAVETECSPFLGVGCIGMSNTSRGEAKRQKLCLTAVPRGDRDGLADSSAGLSLLAHVCRRSRSTGVPESCVTGRRQGLWQKRMSTTRFSSSECHLGKLDVDAGGRPLRGRKTVSRISPFRRNPGHVRFPSWFWMRQDKNSLAQLHAGRPLTEGSRGLVRKPPGIEGHVSKAGFVDGRKRSQSLPVSRLQAVARGASKLLLRY